MKIVIVGLGEVGEALAAKLGEESNDVTVVDVSAERVKYITTRYDVMGVVGNGAIYSVQKEAGIKGADLMIAVTNSDELNLLCCLIARKNSDCKVIARVQSPDYSSESEYLKYELGLSMVINPKMAAAEEIARVLRFPSAMKIEPFAKGKVELLTFKMPENSPLIGLATREIATKLRCEILVCTVERGDEIFIPTGDFTFEKGDLISVVTSPRRASGFFKKIGFSCDSVRSAIIVGTSEITHYLSALLQKSPISAKLIDKNLPACESFAELHEHLTVINGDETDQDLLIEEGVESTDAFIALTDDDEENISLSIFAKNAGAKKLITSITRPAYDDIIKHLDLDTTIYAKNITSDMIVRFVRSLHKTRGSNMESMYNIKTGKVEAAEFVVTESSQIVRIPIAELPLKPDVLIAAIIRDKSVIIPRGQDEIIPGDDVIVVSKMLGLHDISDILR